MSEPENLFTVYKNLPI